MTSDEDAADQTVDAPRLPADLTSRRLLVELAEAVHAALRAAQQAWAVRPEAGSGEAESPVTYEDPSESRVAAPVAAGAVIEHLQGVEFARPAGLAPELVGRVSAGLRYEPAGRSNRRCCQPPPGRAAFSRRCRRAL
jgi:hypothetical protein